MSIENSWNGLTQRQDDDLAALLEPSRLSKLSSHNPLEKIRKNLLMNIVFGFIVCFFYVFIITYYNILQVQIAIGCVLIFSLWALLTAWQEYKKINSSALPSLPVLIELKRHHQSISAWLITQQRVALFVYPVSASGGFMLGGVIGSGKPVEAFIGSSFILISLLVTLIILVPASYYLAKWFSKISFGKHLKALEENIKDLEKEE